MLQWLQTCPLWDSRLSLCVDMTGAMPGQAGLYPRGVQELSRREDLLGNVRVQLREQFILYVNSVPRRDNYQNSQWLQALQHWVQGQSAAGLAPAFGDEPARERVTAEQGRLLKNAQAQQVKYTVTLTVEYEKRYVK